MTPDKINRAIAEACGWSDLDINYHCQLIGRFPAAGTIRYVPKYATDLNAMHEAEKALDNHKWWEFVGNLTDVCGGGGALSVSATAAQRAEAFLRTIGKWEDG